MSDQLHDLHDELLALFQRQRLSPVQRRIAHYLLEHPGEAGYLSSSELARKASVSQPSVSRFIQAVGFESYSSFVSHMRELAMRHIHESSVGAKSRFQDAVADEIHNLEALDRELRDDHVLESLGRNLAASRPLVVIGLRASRDIARFVGFFASKIHPDVRVINEAGSRAHDQLIQANDDGATWVAAFAMPRVPRDTVRLLETAKQARLKVACVAADRFTPVSDYADTLIRAPVGTRLIFDSQAAPLVAAAAIVDAIAEADADRSQSRLEAFEKRAAQGEYFVH